MNQIFKYFLFIFLLTFFSSTYAQVDSKLIGAEKNNLWKTNLWETKLFLDKEVEIYPLKSINWLNRANAYLNISADADSAFAMKDPDAPFKALEYITKAIILDTQNGRPGSIAKEATNLVSGNNKSKVIDAFINMASIKYEKLDYLSAYKYVSKAYEIEPNDTTVAYWKGSMSSWVYKHDEAKEAFKNYILNKGKDINAFIEISKFYLENKDIVKYNEIKSKGIALYGIKKWKELEKKTDSKTPPVQASKNNLQKNQSTISSSKFFPTDLIEEHEVGKLEMPIEEIKIEKVTKPVKDESEDTYEPPVDPDAVLSPKPVEPPKESKVINKTVQPANPYKSKIDIDYLIKNRLPFFTNPSQAFVKSNTAGYSDQFEGIINLNPTDNSRFSGGRRMNRFLKLSLYPIQRINDFLVICISSVDQKKSRQFGQGANDDNLSNLYLINLKIAENLDEISIYPSELNLSNMMLLQLMNYWKISNSNELKCLFNSVLDQYETSYVWKNEFLMQDIINNKINDIKKLKSDGTLSATEYKLEFKSTLDNYNFQNKGFSLELGQLIYYSKFLNNFPLDLLLSFPKNTLSFSKKHFNVNPKSHEFGDPNIDFYTNNKIFYGVNESEARSLVNNLNSKREVMISLDLKMEAPQNGKLNFCELNSNKALFNVKSLKIEPFRISKTSNSLQVKSLEQIIPEIQDLRINGGFAWDEINIQQNISNIEDLFFYNENIESAPQKIKNETFFSFQNEVDNTAANAPFLFNFDQQAEFPGGPRAFGAFLQVNLKYPKAAQRANVGGKVYIQFDINTDGTIEDVEVLKSVGFGCDEEAIRVIKSVPKWIPAKLNGIPVRTRFTQPITFVLSE